jgi:hypothetical protein
MMLRLRPIVANAAETFGAKVFIANSGIEGIN